MPKRPKLEIEELTLEVTRACNMNCPHCLRGGPGQGRMSARALHDLLRQTESIGNVTFTGGEPSLAIDVMKKFTLLCQSYNIPVQSFFIATNGKQNLERLTLFALQFWTECQDRDACALALSLDPYHEPIREPNILQGLKFYSDSKTVPPDRLDWEIPAGSALDNGIGSRNTRHVTEKFQFGRAAKKSNVHVEQLYLSSNGLVYPDCDLSWAEMDAAMDDPDSCPTDFLLLKSCAEQLFRTMPIQYWQKEGDEN